MAKYGWNDNGEYDCPCGTGFGKNLLGGRPFLLVSQHVCTCVPNMLHVLRTGHPVDRCPQHFEPEVWKRAVREYLNPSHLVLAIHNDKHGKPAYVQGRCGDWMGTEPLRDQTVQQACDKLRRAVTHTTEETIVE